MAQTVIGFFDDASEARRAVDQLVSNGFDRNSIDISERSGDSSASDVSSSHENESGISRFFKSLFGDNDDDANRYSTVGHRSTIVSVLAQSADEAERAADLLDDYGAINVNERASEYGYAANTRSTESDFRDVSSTGDVSRTGNEREASIPRVEESLEVGKREVETGGVRVRSRIVERPVEEHVRLRQEHVHVERNPVNRPIGDGDLDRLQDQTIELTERSEVPVVNKEARVTEEIRISKDVDTRDETIRDTVRNTEVDIENLGSRNDVTGSSDNDLNRNDTFRDEDDLRNRPGRL